MRGLVKAPFRNAEQELFATTTFKMNVEIG